VNWCLDIAYRIFGNPNTSVWITALLMFLLLVLPVIAYLMGGWKQRREDIISGLSTYAIELYFTQFHPSFPIEKSHTREEAFSDYYSRQFGRRHFIIPLLLLAAVALTALLWTGLSVIDWLSRTPLGSGHLPELAVSALLGAYMYSTSDLISRWRSCDLSPSDLWWQSFRLSIAVPMAYAISSAFNQSIALAVAFLLGAFPTAEVQKIARRFVAKRVDLGDVPESPKSELQKLQGIDVINAERLGAEGISTLVQLAYADPIKLAIRTNISFSAIVDYMSQALLWIYVTDDLPKLAKIGLRGAYEMRALWQDFTEPRDQKEQYLARALLAKAATRIGMDTTEMENVWQMVALDPYSIFLCEVW
jgi:hypothetical protein